MRMPTAVCVAALVLSSSAAWSQTYTIETRWVAVNTSVAQGAVGSQVAAGSVVNSTDSTVPALRDGSLPGSTIVYGQRYDLQARVVNVTGQPNSGILAVRGNINATNPVLHNPTSVGGLTGLGDRSPYNFFGAGEQYRSGGAASTAPQVDEIFEYSADRDAFPQFVWRFDSNNASPEPFPNPPANLGADASWVSVYRVLVQMRNDVAGDVTTISTTQADSRGLQFWVAVPNPLPEPTEDTPEVVFNYLGLQMTGEATRLNSSFSVVFVPAPASAGLLGLAGLVAMRRRR